MANNPVAAGLGAKVTGERWAPPPFALLKVQTLSSDNFDLLICYVKKSQYMPRKTSQDKQ